MGKSPTYARGMLAVLGLVLGLTVWGCLPPGPAPEESRLAQDSIVADLFTLGVHQRMREGGARLTPLGESLLEAGADTAPGENLVFPTGPGQAVRAFSAYVRHDRDMHCDPAYAGNGALLIQYDDGLEGSCHDTAFAWVPAYPYRTPIAAAYLEGKGFWIKGGDLPFARGSLVIHFDHFSRGDSRP